MLIKVQTIDVSVKKSWLSRSMVFKTMRIRSTHLKGNFIKLCEYSTSKWFYKLTLKWTCSALCVKKNHLIKFSKMNSPWIFHNIWSE